MRRKNKKLPWIIFFIIFLLLLIALSFGDRGFIRQILAYQNQNRLKKNINKLSSEVKSLEDEKKNLDDPETIKKIAREEYGMAKKDEDVYRIVPEK